MGDALGSVFGASKSTDATQEPDAVAQALNQQRLVQLSNLFAGAPYSSFASERPDIYTPSTDIADLFSNIGKQDLGLSSFNLEDMPDIDYSNLMSLTDYIKMGLDETGNYISKIATPEIMSQLALAGLEGSGASADAIARATAQIGLPFVQSLPGASTALTLARPQAELIRQQAGLTGGQRGLLPYQAGMMNAQGGLFNTQRASTLFPMADYSRALQESDLLRRQGVVTTGLTGLPFTPGSTTEQKQTQPPLFGFFGQG